MLSEAFRRLSKFGSVESYQYVGFGSIWFSDFMHFHRTLGIGKMISIEREINHKRRFEFNKPFGGVELRFGSSAAELPKIDLSIRSICWLDYDDPLTKSMLADVRTLASRMSSGSALVVSIQVENPPLVPNEDNGPDEPKMRSAESIEELKSTFGPERVPMDATASDLRGWKLASLVMNMVKSEISDALDAINISRPVQQRMEFRQFITIQYADGAKMATIGGVFVDRGQFGIYASCGFDELEFYRDGSEALRIEIPKLTPKEMRDLDTKLPIGEGQTLDAGCAPERDATAYGKLYRYLPSFASFEP
jgi:hypothetical protein